ncbi:MBL fold metallo-hydrolase [Aromatoleum bremense]|uniref:MBL fold metallo-hydrolase n=1 Tax=Aromatoleum bremense TaxID=76115 RepID=A0ABX1NY14_9RHOO|nr:MBL fold metallo-hydrolase [Aromatoleum bremense]NMG16934.1 MBL fold metallo-hydrolase [Aromatoleum bremense]QTQ31695.1 Metallo-beta-lactamase domain-containing protein [Aromatoleum bremense]
MIDLRIVPVTPFEQNCSIVWCDKTRKAAVVDPGGNLERILAKAKELGVTIEKILITHGHIDHAGGTAQLARELGVPVEGPQEADLFWIAGIPQQAKTFGFPGAESFEPDRWLHDGDTVTVGDETLRVIHVPGHTPGHVAFFHADARLAIVGDVLFAGSIGRTDFPQGDHATLIRSIRQKLFPLGDDITFVPGHGPTSTFGEERRSNPYVGDHA